jgi:hypothetical protein
MGRVWVGSALTRQRDQWHFGLVISLKMKNELKINEMGKNRNKICRRVNFSSGDFVKPYFFLRIVEPYL